MAKFDSIDSYLSHLEDTVLEASLTALSHYTSTTLADIMIDEINATVYNAYQGTYQRREEMGGLTDRENINIVEVIMKDKKLHIKVRNTTLGAEDDAGRYIDAIIVNGVGYTWERSKIYKAEQKGTPIKRDFYAPTREIIEDLLRSDFIARMRLLSNIYLK